MMVPNSDMYNFIVVAVLGVVGQSLALVYRVYQQVGGHGGCFARRHGGHGAWNWADTLTFSTPLHCSLSEAMAA